MSNWDIFNTKDTLDVLFSYFFIINVYYSYFEKLLKGFFTPLISSNANSCQVVIIYYG